MKRSTLPTWWSAQGLLPPSASPPASGCPASPGRYGGRGRVSHPTRSYGASWRSPAAHELRSSAAPAVALSQSPAEASVIRLVRQQLLVILSERAMDTRRDASFVPQPGVCVGP